MADAIADVYNIWSLEIQALYARARDAHAADAADRGVSDSSSAYSQQDALKVQYDRLTNLLRICRDRAAESGRPELLMNFGPNIPPSWYIAPYAFAITAAIRQSAQASSR